jgi:hypothetical protein
MRKLAEQVLVQLTEADVESGFGLVDEAKAYRISGRPELSSRALQNARSIVAEVELRLQRLGNSAFPFLALLAELREEIAAMERDAA